MEYLARWGPKGFIISPSQIVTMDNLKTSIALKNNSENDTSGTPPTNTRGRELQPVTFSTTYMAGAGVDPRAQIDDWEAQLGKSYPLIINGKRFGPEKLKLTKVDAEVVLMNNRGVFLEVIVNITMEEHSDGKTSKLATTKVAAKSTVKNTSASSGGKSSKNTVVGVLQGDKANAMNATASKTDRAQKKTSKGGR